MFSFSEAIVNILIGLGWFPINLMSPQHIYVFHLLNIYFQVLGLWLYVKTNNKRTVSWVLSSLFQVLMIFLVNLSTGYAFRARQLIFVLPVLCLLSASGAIDIYQRGYHFIKRCFLIKVSRFFNIKHIYVFCVMIIVLGISGSCLQEYYRLEKSSRREISIELIQRWKPNTVIWTTPHWEDQYYSFYLTLLGHPEVKNAIFGKENIQGSEDVTLPICWITDGNILPEEEDIMKEMGFEIVPLRSSPILDAQILWCR
ncbi:hypothetical protein SE15_00620 [Thermanaerothrix daxensis]|uniref:Glycosyltransferase RgtA/B/C/D-like domain-containing protein n=2 Tax=Thermanaerothrix daxensis TaxID=869279 RepID=A0A0P6Y350_9CHLR|nr:hypothetical protein SE15_00620 [Thermanaerothrix daxensis]